jgi:peroxiredoxin
MAELGKIWRHGNLTLILFLAVPSGLVFLARLGYLPSEMASQALERPGQMSLAPDFSLLDSHGNRQRLSMFRGRVVLLNFWTTWCAPCQAEMPALERFYQTHRERGLTVLAVSSDRQGGTAVAPFLERHHLSFTALLDSTGEVTRMYGVSSLPTSYLLDRQGRLVTVATGGSLWAESESLALITSLLDAGTSSPVEAHTTTAQGPSAKAEAGMPRSLR